jgi:hypothetical protein
MLTTSFSVKSASEIIPFSSKNAIPIEDQMCISHAPAEYDDHLNNLDILSPKILRNNIEWFSCARTFGKDAGKYDFSRYNTTIANLNSRGIEFLGCFVYGWGWWPNSNELPRADWPYYFDFVSAFCQEFKDNITYYEMWNEPNIGFWPGTDLEFFEFLGNITEIVKTNDPTSFILCPSTASPDIEFMEDMINYFGDDVFDEMFDAVAYHAYSGRNAEYVTQKIYEVQQWIEKHNFHGEVWITEIGMSTNVATYEQIDTHLEDLLDYQAVQLLKIYAETIGANITTTFWYCQNDWCDTDELHGEGSFGLMYCANTTSGRYEYKPSGHTYILLNSLISNSVYYPEGINLIGQSTDNIWGYYFFTPRNTTVLILWSQNVANKASISIVSPSSSMNQVKFDLTYYNYTSNSSTAVLGKDLYEFQLENRPVIFEINYTKDLLDNGLLIQPLTIEISITHSIPILIFIILGPTLLAVSIIILVNRKKRAQNIHKNSNKGEKNHE